MKSFPLKPLILLFLAMGQSSLLARAQQKDVLRFAVITDTHIGKPGNDKSLATIVQDINQNPEIDFVLHAGDVSDFGYNDELGKAKELMDGLAKPYFIVPGNHDTGWSASGGLVYDQLWKEQKFVTDMGGVRFIGFSTGPYGRMSRGYVPLDQMRWLDSLVQVTPKEQRVIFISHYPLDEGMSNYQELIDKLHQLNTLAVFCGHGHVNKLYDYEGITGIMTRTAQIRQNTVGYNIVTLSRDSLKVKAVEVGKEPGDFWAALPAAVKKERIQQAPVNKTRTPIPVEHQGVKAVWEYQDQGNIVSTPAIWKNQILYGNLLGDFKSVNSEKKKFNWCFKAGQAIYASPEVAGNKVVFASADSSIYCLNARNGKLLWQVKTGAPVVASPTIGGNTVYIGSSDSVFRALDLSNGRQIWAFEGLEGFPASKPTIAEGKIIFGTWGKTLYALNQKDGSLAWKWINTERSHYYSPAMAVPVVQNKKVYMVAPDEKLREFDLTTGKETFQTGRSRVRESLGGHAEKGLIVAKTMQDSVVAWSTKSGTPEPILNLYAGFGNDFSASMPVFQGNNTFFGTTFGRVYAVDVTNKKVIWVYQVGNDMVNTVRALPNGQVLAASVDGKVVILEGINPKE